MVTQHPGRGLDRHVSQSLRIQELARDLRARDAPARADLRVFGHIRLDAPLRVNPQQQTGKHKNPKQWVAQHDASSPVTGKRSPDRATAKSG